MTKHSLPSPLPGSNCSARRGAAKKDTAKATEPAVGPDSVNGAVDERLQLTNDQQRGPIHDVSLPEAAIASLHGILLDVDLARLRSEIASSKTRANTKRFWKRVVRKWLRRHPVFAKARVVSSGRGLHVIIRLAPAVVFETEADRQKWAAVVKIVQKLLPTDPDCPGITALTRPVGSVNGKNDETVQVLHDGEAVHPDEVLALCAQAASRPFATVVGLLYGGTQISPCPVCLGEGGRLGVLDHVGMCYGGCGKVNLGQIFNRFLKPQAARGQEGGHLRWPRARRRRSVRNRRHC